MPNPDDLWICLDHPCYGVDCVAWEQGGWPDEATARANGYERLDLVRQALAEVERLRKLLRSLYGTVSVKPTWQRKWPVIDEKVRAELRRESS